MAAFISVLHLYESFGWWRKADYLKVHFAESWNEMHHLLIMEVMLLFCLELPRAFYPSNTSLSMKHHTKADIVQSDTNRLVLNTFFLLSAQVLAS